MAQPSRHLYDKTKPHKYVPAVQTDIRRTFRKARLLQAKQRKEG